MRILPALPLMAAAACTSSSMPEPRITSVTATSVSVAPFSDEVITLVVEGENFGTGIVSDAESGDASKVERASLRLVGLEGQVLLVEGTYLGPTRIDATLPANALDPDFYDVTVRNPDETSDTHASAFHVWGVPAQVELAGPAALTPTAGESVPISARLRDADGDATLARASITLGIVLDSADASAPESITFVAQTDSASFAVMNTVVESVQISLAEADLDAAGLTANDVMLQFLAAPAAFVRLVEGAELQPTDNFFETVLRLEDEFGNPAMHTADYTAILDGGAGTCVTGQVNSSAQATVTIAEGSSEIAVNVSCPAGDADVTVLLTETTTTGLDPISAIADFDFTTP